MYGFIVVNRRAFPFEGLVQEDRGRASWQLDGLMKSPSRHRLPSGVLARTTSDLEETKIRSCIISALLNFALESFKLDASSLLVLCAVAAFGAISKAN